MGQKWDTIPHRRLFWDTPVRFNPVPKSIPATSFCLGYSLAQQVPRHKGTETSLLLYCRCLLSLSIATLYICRFLLPSFIVILSLSIAVFYLSLSIAALYCYIVALFCRSLFVAFYCCSLWLYCRSLLSLSIVALTEALSE